MIRTTFILLISIFFCSSAIAGDRCCRKCVKYEKHICKTMCGDNGKYEDDRRYANMHKECCSSITDGCDHHCAFCFHGRQDCRSVDGMCHTCWPGEKAAKSDKYEDHYNEGHGRYAYKGDHRDYSYDKSGKSYSGSRYQRNYRYYDIEN